MNTQLQRMNQAVGDEHPMALENQRQSESATINDVNRAQ